MVEGRIAVGHLYAAGAQIVEVYLPEGAMEPMGVGHSFEDAFE